MKKHFNNFIFIIFILSLINCTSVNRNIQEEKYKGIPYKEITKVLDGVSKSDKKINKFSESISEYKDDYLLKKTYKKFISNNKNKIKKTNNFSSDIKENFVGDESSPFSIGISPTIGYVQEKHFKGLRGISINLGINDLKSKFVIELGYERADLIPTSDLGKAINKKVDILKLAFYMRKYISTTKTFFGLYYFFGGSFDLYYWNYKNTLSNSIYDEYGNYLRNETTKSDYIRAYEILSGIGLTILQTKYIDIGFNVSPSLLIFDYKTGYDYENDNFEDMFYLRYKFYCDIKY